MLRLENNTGRHDMQLFKRFNFLLNLAMYNSHGKDLYEQERNKKTDFIQETRTAWAHSHQHSTYT